MKFVCEKCAHEIGGMPPYERFKAFCPNCKKLAWFTPKKLNQTTTAQQGKGNNMKEEEAKLNMGQAVACERATPRTTSSVVCELSYERREVSNLLEKLNKAIDANPDCVSAHHKELWRKQAKAMREYVDVLGERIKDLIDNG